MTCGIYGITNTINGKLYIGSSIKIEKRWQSHLHALRHGKDSPLKEDWGLYGEAAFKWEIVKVCEIESLLEMEQYYIDTLRPAYNRNKKALSPMVGKILSGKPIPHNKIRRLEAYRSQKFIGALKKILQIESENT
jgi:group I intron endonuclease